MEGLDKPVLSNVEGLIPAYNVFLLIEKLSKPATRRINAPCGYPPIRTFPGANPSGALRASKFVPDAFVFGQAKTNSPGATIPPEAEWDEQRSPEGQRPVKDVVSLDSRRANPTGLPWRSRSKRVSREGHPGLVGAAPQGVCSETRPRGETRFNPTYCRRQLPF